MPTNQRNVFLAPASSEHVNETVFVKPVKGIKVASIQGLIPIDRVAGVLTPTEREALEKVYPDGMIRMWGTRSISDLRWDSIKNGDHVLFYHKGTYIYLGELAYKSKNGRLAQKVWKAYLGATWNVVFFVKNVRPINIAKEALNKAAGYEEDFGPQAFMAVREKGLSKVLEILLPELADSASPLLPFPLTSTAESVRQIRQQVG